MTRRFIALMLIMMSVTLSLLSCRIGGSDDGDTSGNGTSDGDLSGGGSADTGNGDTGGPSGSGNGTGASLIYDGSTGVSIVTDDKDARKLMLDVKSLLEEKLGRMLTLVGSSETPAQHEIVVGPSDREVSQAAYKRLERFRTQDDDSEYSRFLIYSDGSSVAIAYDSDALGVGVEAACEYFSDNYVKESLSLPTGTVYREAVEQIAYVAERDERLREEKWAALAEAVDTEVYEALRSYYALYDKDVISWMADLYDPAIGGFYYSNSARNTQGYLPDLESTRQVMDFIHLSGMLPSGETLGSAVPEWMQKQIIYFVKSLQSEKDGCFYHPQWGESIGTSRRSRDLGWATGILSYLGASPTYDTPNNYKGDGILADGTPVSDNTAVAYRAGVKTRLGASSAMAVSKVVSTSAVTSGPFSSVSAFREYIENFETAESYVNPRSGLGGIRYNSYVIGNELAAQYSIIETQDKILYEREGVSIKKILFDYLNPNQNPTTGAWDWTPEGSEGYDPYESVNGLLKICTVYYYLDEPMPYCSEAVATGVEAILCSTPPPHACATYNTWFAINYCLKIMREISDEGEEADKLVESIRANSAEAIKTTFKKLGKHQKTDGSCSYYPTSSAWTSQNAPAAVPHTNEGDVNATVIALNHTADQMASALGISGYMPKKFGNAEWLTFIKILENQGAVIKDVIPYYDPEITDSSMRGSGIYADKAINFSNTTVAELAEAGKVGTNAANDGIKERTFAYDDLAELKNASITAPGNNHALEYSIYSDGDPYIIFHTDKRTVDKNTDSYVFETDFLYESGTSPDSNGENAALSFYFFKAAKGTVVDYWYPGGIFIRNGKSEGKYEMYFARANSEGTYGSIEISTGVFYTLRVEIDNVKDARADVRYYLNGKLVHSYSDSAGINGLQAVGARYSFATNDGRLFLDNTYFSAVSEDGTEYVDTNTYHELPDYERGEGKYAAVAEQYNTTAQALADGGFMMSYNTGLGDVNFQREEGLFTAYVRQLDGDRGLDYRNTGSGDPYLYLLNKAGNGQDMSCDTYIFETDINLVSADFPSSDGGYFMFYAVTDTDTNKHMSGVSWFVSMNADGDFYLCSVADTENRAIINTNEWYNLRIEIANVRSGQAKVSTYINGALISSTVAAGGFFDVEAMAMRFSWTENNGRVLLDNTVYTSIDESAAPEEGESARGTGEYKSSAESYDRESESLADLGYGSIDEAGHSIVLGGTSGHYATVVTVGGDKALDLTSAETYAPYLYINNFVKGTTTTACDSYIFETDFRFEAISTPSSSGMYFELYPSKGEGVANHWFGGAIYLKKDAESGSFYLTCANVTEENKTPIELCRWYNLRIEIDDVRGATTMKIFLNGELLYSCAPAGGDFEIDSFIMRFSWNEQSGKVLLDNTYFSSFTEEGDEVDGAEPPPTEDVELSGSRAEGEYSDVALGFDGVILPTLKEEGKLGSITAGTADVTFGASGVAYAQIVSVGGDEALKFGSTAGGDPVLLFKPTAVPTNISNDTYVLEFDFCYAGGTYTEGSLEETAVAYITLNVKATKYSVLTAAVMYNNKTGAYRLQINSGYGYCGSVGGVSYDINLKEWYNIKIVLSDTLASGGSVGVYINGESVVSWTAAFSLDSANIGGYTGVDAAFYHRWGCNDSVMYIDNIYHAATEDGDEPPISYRGTGLYYEESLKYTDVTATGLNTDKLLTSTTDTGESYNFDNATAINPVFVSEIEGDAALDITKNNNHDPELIMRSSAEQFTMAEGSDSIVMEFDICFDNLTRSQAGNSGKTLFWIILDKGYSTSVNPVGRGSGFYVNQVSTTDEGGLFFSFNGENLGAVILDAWYNVRLEFSDMSKNSSSVKVFINGEEVYSGSLSGAPTETVGSVEMFNSWSETGGRVYVDNLYLGEKTK